MTRLSQRSRSPSRSRSPGRNEGLLLGERIKEIEKIKVQDRTSDEKRELKKLKMKRSKGGKKNESLGKRRQRLDAMAESKRKRR